MATIAPGIALMAGLTQAANAARPATRAETAALRRGARSYLPFRGSLSSLNVATHACISTIERRFAVAIVFNPRMRPQRTLTLFHYNPHLDPAWDTYAFGSPQNVWFSPRPMNPYKTRLRAEHDLKAHCSLPAWALKT